MLDHFPGMRAWTPPSEVTSAACMTRALGVCRAGGTCPLRGDNGHLLMCFVLGHRDEHSLYVLKRGPRTRDTRQSRSIQFKKTRGVHWAA